MPIWMTLTKRTSEQKSSLILIQNFPKRTNIDIISKWKANGRNQQIVLSK